MSAQTVFNQALTLITTNGDSGALTVTNFVELAVDINITGNQGSGPTVQFFIDRLGSDSGWYPIWQSSVISSSSISLSTSIGAGLAYNQSFGATIRFRRTIGGSSTP